MHRLWHSCCQELPLRHCGNKHVLRKLHQAQVRDTRLHQRKLQSWHSCHRLCGFEQIRAPSQDQPQDRPYYYRHPDSYPLRSYSRYGSRCHISTEYPWYRIRLEYLYPKREPLPQEQLATLPPQLPRRAVFSI